MARFGARFDAQGVLAGSRDASRCIGYLTKYLTKHLGDCHQADHRRPGRPRRPARRRAALRAVLADLRELAPLRHPAQERPARPAPRGLQGQGPPPRVPRLRRAPRPGLPQVVRQDPGRPPRRPADLADRRCSGFRQPTRAGTPGNRSSLATRTTCPTGNGSCTSSPTVRNGTLRSPTPEPEPAARPVRIFRQQERRPDGGPARRVADRGSGTRRTWRCIATDLLPVARDRQGAQRRPASQRRAAHLAQ